MNLPNRLSLFRIFVIPLFLLCLLWDQFFQTSQFVTGLIRMVALMLAIVVTVTDYMDGAIARKHGICTRLGQLLDPLADKVFITAALVGLVELKVIPAWAVVLVIAREFLVTGLRAIAADAGQSFGADRLGKHKTGWQLGLIITAVLVVAVRDLLMSQGYWPATAPDNRPFELVFEVMVLIPLTVALVLTALSGVNYLMAHRGLLTEDPL